MLLKLATGRQCCSVCTQDEDLGRGVLVLRMVASNRLFIERQAPPATTPCMVDGWRADALYASCITAGFQQVNLIGRHVNSIKSRTFGLSAFNLQL
jgi:hypothetical protein